MQFLLGFLCGIAVSALMFVIMAFFRAAIERKMIVLTKRLEDAGPKPRGFIFEPPTEDEEAREEIIERNRRAGRDTRISELM